MRATTAPCGWAGVVVLCVAVAVPVTPEVPAAGGKGKTADHAAVRVGADGKLVYARDGRGNAVPDFSNCGYAGGGLPLPTVPVRETLDPVAAGDDGERIQAALDRVTALAPDGDGFRGAVLLRRGRYRIGAVIQIRASGVVLRGEGPGDDGTVLVATGKGKRSLIQAGGTGKPTEVAGSRRRVADRYVPVGARSVRIAGAAAFRPGDAVIVRRPCTQQWVRDLGMDRLPPRKDGGTVTQWKEGSQVLDFDRVVTAVDGDRVHLDAPLTCALEDQYGGGFVFQYEFPGRVRRVGVEELRGVSEYRGATDEDHGWTLVEVKAAADVWVRKVTAVHFGYAAVLVNAGAKWVTVRDCACLDPISQITGMRRYSFNLNGGQLTLWERCHARNGRHDFVTGGRVAGPSVFVDCTAEKAHADAGPHQRWAVGILYDNVRTDGELNVRNRGNAGTGHGWAGANHVFWNCAARSIVCERPPTAHNWAIGCTAKQHRGDGTWEAFGRPVQPRSLYRAQLAERVGAAREKE